MCVLFVATTCLGKPKQGDPTAANRAGRGRGREAQVGRRAGDPDVSDVLAGVTQQMKEADATEVEVDEQRDGERRAR